MFIRLFAFLENSKSFTVISLALEKSHSTHMALTILMDKITESLEKGEFVIGVFIDFSKASDTVNHDILQYFCNFICVQYVPFVHCTFLCVSDIGFMLSPAGFLASFALDAVISLTLCSQSLDQSSFIQVRVCCLLGAKPCPDPGMIQCLLDLWEQVWKQFYSQY